MLSDAFALLPCFIFNLRILLSISCKADALLTKSLVFFLLSLEDFKDNFAKYNIIGFQVFVIILNI